VVQGTDHTPFKVQIIILTTNFTEGLFSVSQSLFAQMGVWTDMQTHGFDQTSFSKQGTCPPEVCSAMKKSANGKYKKCTVLVSM